MKKVFLTFFVLVLLSGLAFAGIVAKVSKKGEMLEKSFLKGEKVVATQTFNKEGKLVRASAKIPDGVARSYYPKWLFWGGQLQTKTTYRNGKENGPYKYYYKNGKIKYKWNYTKGKINGQAQTFYDNGKLESAGTLKNDRWIGLYKQYYKSGKPAYKIVYNSKGKKISEIQYDMMGKVVKPKKVK